MLHYENFIQHRRVLASNGVVRQNPSVADRIARSVLQVETANYQAEECHNVATGHAIESFDLFFEHLKQPQPVIEFVKRQLNNRRNAVKRKAARYLKKYMPSK